MSDDALIHLRVPASLKARWVRESRAAGLRLTDWILQRVEPRAWASMTPDQFAVLAGLLRLRTGPAKNAAKLHFVDGMTISEASKLSGIKYRDAWSAIQRCRKGLDSVRSVIQGEI